MAKNIRNLQMQTRVSDQATVNRTYPCTENKKYTVKISRLDHTYFIPKVDKKKILKFLISVC